jgi:uncharacterized protein (UPF0276 family)
MRWQSGFLPGPPLRNLEKVRRHLPVHLHGVAMSLGSADPLNWNYLQRLKELIDRIQPEIVSDHLCWTGVDGENLHDLLPLPYTEEAITRVADKIIRVQDFLKKRILIENLSSYVTFKHSEMTEWEFIGEIVSRADCGILLDINNVFVSSVNHGFAAKDYLSKLPHERIGQIHLAGHSVQDDGLLIDTHDSSVCDNVWSLYAWYTGRFGVRSTMIERDENIPEWTDLECEVSKIFEIQETANEPPDARSTSATL